MSTGLMMMLKSLGIDPKMIEGVAKAVQMAAIDLRTIKEQQAEILRRLDAMEKRQEPALTIAPEKLLEVSSGK